MLLRQVTITGYRSVTGTVSLHLDPAVTVILGANDHGKTNILRAIEHLNSDNGFSPADDISWDRDDVSNVPSVEFLFELSAAERAEIDERALPTDQAKGSQSIDRQGITEGEDDEGEDDEGTDRANGITGGRGAVSYPPTPAQVIVRRTGVGAPLVFEHAATREPLSPAIEDFVPFVELIEPTTNVSDTVTAAEIAKPETGFMRGIFWYAGLDPDESADLFVQTHKTTRRLEVASARLNATIKKSWSQGKDLHFILQHNSAKKSIELMIKDPAVQNRYVSPSNRSAGFTQFFTVKTILYARQREHSASSYILLFDEPGIYLHPAGQQDLLQVIESLAKTHQTIYVTHSLFMINKSYPVRHRLVTKSAAGTEIEGKPYVGRWARALSALGMSLSGTILFANHVLLTEGDSDPIYLNAIMQKLIEVGKLDVDLNAFAAIATGQTSDADALVRILLESQPAPSLGVLLDGDKGGKERLNRIQPLLMKHEIPSKVLKEDATIEDYLPNLSDVWVEAVARYVFKVLGDSKDGDTWQRFYGQVVKSFEARFPKDAQTKGVCAWVRDDVTKLAGLAGPPSKVGIAREYATLMQAVLPSEFRTGTICRPLVNWIVEALKMGAMGVDESKVLEDTDSVVSA